MVVYQMVSLQGGPPEPVSWWDSSGLSVGSGQACPEHPSTQSHSWTWHWPSEWTAAAGHPSAWGQNRNASGWATQRTWGCQFRSWSEFLSHHVGAPTPWSKMDQKRNFRHTFLLNKILQHFKNVIGKKKNPTNQVLQFPPAEWRLLHQDGVSQHVEGGLHIWQHSLHGCHVPTTWDGGQCRLDILRPGNLSGQDHQLGLWKGKRSNVITLTLCLVAMYTESLLVCRLNALNTNLVTINPGDVLTQVNGCALVEGCDLCDRLS